MIDKLRQLSRAWLHPRRIAVVAVALVAVAALGVASAYLQLVRWAATPLPVVAEGVVVEVVPGTSLRQVATRLRGAGLLAQPRRFEHLARLRGVAGRLQAGEYHLTPPLTPDTLLALLVAGRVWLHTLTLSEGLTVAEIGQRVEAAGISSAADFVAACGDPAVVAAAGAPAGALEGYLLPESYQWQRGATGADLALRMAQAMAVVWTPARAAAAQALGLSRHQALTLASIVEKGTGRAEERPIIAALFLNRLSLGMRLQSDPTVIYGLPAFDGNLTLADLAHDTPYNTYTRNGLPPTPICNPGVAAIDAVLKPTQTDALYFVARGDGSHVFSASLADHERRVDRYQRHPRATSATAGATAGATAPVAGE